MSAYTTFIGKTTATEPNLVQNWGGGFAYQIDKWVMFNRFLIMGSEQNRYYVSEQKLTAENAKAVLACIQEDGARAVKEIVEISVSGRAHKQSPVLFALALAAAKGDVKTREAALSALPQVARTGSFFFEFIEYVNSMRGWGSQLKRLVADWYLSKNPNHLAYQVLKYQSRTIGKDKNAKTWSHANVLQLCHGTKVFNGSENDMLRNAVLDYIVHGEYRKELSYPSLVDAVQEAKTADKTRVIELVLTNGLTREMIPTQFLNDKDVNAALLRKGMPLTALVRNLANLTRYGVLDDQENLEIVLGKLADQEYISDSRMHPLTVLQAYNIYKSGRGERNTWAPKQSIVNALNTAFYLAFKNAQPTGKNFYIAVDVSPSMNYPIPGVDGLTSAQIATILSMVVARNEPFHQIRGFASAGYTRTAFGTQKTPGLVDLGINASMSLDQAMAAGARHSGAWTGTDCTLPVQDAIARGLLVDVFVVITDNETNQNTRSVQSWLQQYRQKSGRAGKMIVLATYASPFSIADPNDPNSLDIAGFDSAVPALIEEFAKQ